MCVAAQAARLAIAGAAAAPRHRVAKPSLLFPQSHSAARARSSKGRSSRNQASTNASARLSIRRLGEVIYQAVVVERGGRNAKALGASGDGRIVYGLNIDAVLGQQQIARRFALL